MSHTHELAIFLGQLILLLTVGRLLSELMQRIGQPQVMGQLLAGLLLGPSVLGAFSPDLHHLIFPDSAAQRRMLQGLSELGILLLLLLTGMETNLAAVRSMQRTAISVSLSGIVIPFVCGVILGMVMPENLLPRPDFRLPTALFLGTALSISSVKIVAAVVRDMGFLRRRVGRVMISAAIVDDTLAWIVIAITASLAMHGSVNMLTVGRTLLEVSVFLVVAFTIGRRFVVWAIRWANDHLTIEMPVITAIIVMTAVFALSTELIGVHTVLGAFVAGLLVGRSPILTRQVDVQLRGLIVGLFMPIFFGSAGLQADLTVLLDPRMAMFAGVLIAVASIGKLIGAYTGGLIGGLNLREATALAWGMNARGSTEIIVGTIGLSIGALSKDLFTMIVTMAVVTTLMMPPGLRWALRRVPISEEEKAAEAREAAEADQFLPAIERVLAVVDRSPSGKLAARMAGQLAGSTNKLTAILDIELKADAEPQHSQGLQVALDAAQASKSANESPAEAPAAPPIEAAPQDKDGSVAKNVAAEVAKGYDLVLFGIDGLPAENPKLRPLLEALDESYTGARAFVVARERNPDMQPCILLPVTGADYSRRGAELAIALAAAAEVSLSVLVVSRAAARIPWYRRRPDPLPEDQATIDAIRGLAEHHDVTIRPHIRADKHPEETIIRFGRRMGANLIVLGVKERPGPGPSFGHTADTILREAPCSVLLLST
jgi:Kef-type K+ transport system membrane component KefB/nucleotide-binding universal stress UspA family protein